MARKTHVLEDYAAVLHIAQNVPDHDEREAGAGPDVRELMQRGNEVGQVQIQRCRSPAARLIGVLTVRRHMALIIGPFPWNKAKLVPAALERYVTAQHHEPVANSTTPYRSKLLREYCSHISWKS